MNTSIKQAFNQLLSTRQRWVRDVQLAAEYILPYADALEALVEASEGKLRSYMSFERLAIEVTVTNMRDVSELLETIETITGCEFVRTLDEAGGYQPFRAFVMDDLPLQVNAVLDIDAPEELKACRAIQTGERIVPIYELRCD